MTYRTHKGGNFVPCATIHRSACKERCFFMSIERFQAPIIFVLKITIPHTENHWSQALTIIHCFVCPLFGVAAAKRLVKFSIVL